LRQLELLDTLVENAVSNSDLLRHMRARFTEPATTSIRLPMTNASKRQRASNFCCSQNCADVATLDARMRTDGDFMTLFLRLFLLVHGEHALCDQEAAEDVDECHC
jgi:hypothetical protein